MIVSVPGHWSPFYVVPSDIYGRPMLIFLVNDCHLDVSPSNSSDSDSVEPRHEKTCLRDF